MPSYCAVLGCFNNKPAQPDKSYYTLPSERDYQGVVQENRVKRRQAWIKALHRADLTETKLKYLRICSDHFITGKPAQLDDVDNPDYIPTQNMGYDSNKGNRKHVAKRKIEHQENEVDLNGQKRRKSDTENWAEEFIIRIETDDNSSTTESPDFADVEIVACQQYEPSVNFTFRGLCAPVFNAFNKDLTVNTEIIPKYAKFLADNEIKGVLVHGSTGEGVSLSVAERKSVTEEWVKAVKSTKQHLMVQVGGCPLPDVLELAKHAEEVGADSILCLPELYFKPTTSSQLIDYLKIVGEAAPKTPLLYYHIPMWSGVNINMAEFLNKAVGKLPTFHGIKYTSNDLDGGAAALRANDGKYAVFLGADTLLAAAFTLGFDSAIATTFNIFPQYGTQILKAINESKVEEARKIQEKLSTVCSVIRKNGPWVPTMKVAMNLATPLDVGLVRPPLKNLLSQQSSEMETSLKDLSALQQKYIYL